MHHDTDRDLSRRTLMQGMGGLTAISMAGATIPQAEAALADELSTDPHTRDTYRAIVDAIVPRTPELADELGEEHAAGGLDVELEKFLVWDFNHFHEVRLETLTGAGSLNRPPGSLSPDDLELAVEPAAAGSALDSLLGLDGVDEGVLEGTLDDVNDTLEELLGGFSWLAPDIVGADDLRETLSFGSVERLEITLADDLEPGATGPASFDVVVETADEVVHRVVQNYPYGALFPFVFDLVAAEFVLLRRNEDELDLEAPSFPGGGTFVRLSREDRLRCLWTIVDGGALDRLDGLLAPLVTDVGILKYVVMAVNGLHGFGYYTEWAGYGDTKTDPLNDRHLDVPAGEVQSRRQTGYPGPQSGYAADWRHAVPGGFDDPPAADLDLPDDLAGDDVVADVGGERR